MCLKVKVRLFEVRSKVLARDIFCHCIVMVLYPLNKQTSTKHGTNYLHQLVKNAIPYVLELK